MVHNPSSGRNFRALIEDRGQVLVRGDRCEARRVRWDQVRRNRDGAAGDTLSRGEKGRGDRKHQLWISTFKR